MTEKLKAVVEAYKVLAKVPSIVGARINTAVTGIASNGEKIKSIRVTSKWSVRNLDKGKHTKYTYNYHLNEELDIISKSDFGSDISNELLSAVSPSGELKAVVREEKEGEKKKQYIEVWQSNTLEHCVDLNALDVHGDIYADGEFGCLNWSPDESKLVYVAEKKLPKSLPYVTRKIAKEDETKGSEYVYRQDWGEQLVGKYKSVIVVFTLKEESLDILPGLPDSWCPGQVFFTPDGESVVGVAWETEPRRLGLIFCTNRPGYIFTLDFYGQYSKISSEGYSVRSPRLNLAGDRLVWLQRPEGGPHHAGHQLVSTSWPHDGKIDVLIDIVQHSIAITDGNFTGIYCLALPKRCFTKNDKEIVFSTPQRTEIRSYTYNIENSELRDISDKLHLGSISVLDVSDDVIVGVLSSLQTPPQLTVSRIKDNGQVTWHNFRDGKDNSLDSDVEYLEVNTGSDDIKTIPAILINPKNKKCPLIVWPHGGPHSGFVNAYSLETGLFQKLGFACVQINYRGSTGQGQASVDSLLGHIGEYDVTDCTNATEALLKLDFIDENNVFLFGGSHGGFLVTHLSGQFPDRYSAVVTRNPVIDVTTMINSTDIPDWCAVEAGFPFTEQGPVSETHLTEMRRCSPLAHVHKVKAPTAIMLGAIDKRVPHYQGLEYYMRLKANGCKTKLYMYDDNHSLSTLPAEMDNLINSACWFQEHIKA